MRLLLLAALAWGWSGCGEAAPSAPRPQQGGSSAGGGAPAPQGAPPITLGEGSNPDPLPVGGQPAPPVDDCNRVEISFAPKVPSVFILVDRSSSMFERSLWNPLKEGVLAVIDQLDGEIRFGFSTYTGQVGKCPQLTTAVPLAKQNFAAIKSAYDAVTMPQFKGETPTSLAITEVAAILQKEPADAPKYILLVTDGEPDFCDDPNVTCSRDAVVASVQSAYAKGIGTFIVSIGGQVDPMHLRDVANAGTGQPVTDRQMAVHYQCPMSTATYSAESGNAPFFEPDVSDRAALVSTLADTIAGVRSCVFDLQGKIAIDLKLADQGVVQVDGKQVPYGPPDGYRMNSPTQLELLGAACQRLKQPQTMTVSIDFPCEAVVLL